MASHIKQTTINLVTVLLIVLLVGCSSGGGKGGVNAPYSPVGSSDDPQNDLSLDERVDEIEERVSIIEGDLLQLKPSINTLMAIEGDIQDLVSELSTLTDDDQLATPPAPKTVIPVPESVIPEQNDEQADPVIPALPDADNKEAAVSKPQDLTTEAPKPPPTPEPNTKEKKVKAEKSSPAPAEPKQEKPAAATTSLVETVRIGKHSNTKTRLVADFQKGSIIKQSVDEKDNKVVVTLTDTGWQALADWQSKNIPLVKSYQARTENANTTLSITTSDDDLTVKFFTLPQSDKTGPRLVLDFEKGI